MTNQKNHLISGILVLSFYRMKIFESNLKILNCETAPLDNIDLQPTLSFIKLELLT